MSNSSVTAESFAQNKFTVTLVDRMHFVQIEKVVLN